MYRIDYENIVENETRLAAFQHKVITVRNENKRLCNLYNIKPPFEEHMTPNEELFKRFFAEVPSLVKDMDDLQLRAFREEMSEIALKARAYLYGADEEEKSRNKRNKSFSAPTRNLEQDEISSNAINAIKTRKERMSKTDKAIENLMKLPGFTREMAENLYSAKKLVEVRDIKAKSPSASTADIVKSIVGDSSASSINSAKTESDKIVENKPFVNPFAKKE